MPEIPLPIADWDLPRVYEEVSVNLVASLLAASEDISDLGADPVTLRTMLNAVGTLAFAVDGLIRLVNLIVPEKLTPEKILRLGLSAALHPEPLLVDPLE